MNSIFHVSAIHIEIEKEKNQPGANGKEKNSEFQFMLFNESWHV
jgi:hypothetical protein